MMEREERRSGKRRREVLEKRGTEWAVESVENDDG